MRTSGTSGGGGAAVVVARCTARCLGPAALRAGMGEGGVVPGVPTEEQDQDRELQSAFNPACSDRVRMVPAQRRRAQVMVRRVDTPAPRQEATGHGSVRLCRVDLIDGASGCRSVILKPEDA